MPLYRNPNSPYWWVRTTINGTKVRRSTGTTDRTEAEEYEQHLRTQLWRERKLGDKTSKLFVEAAERYLNESQAKTKARAQQTLEWFLAVPGIGNATLADLDTDACYELQRLLSETGIAPVSVDRYMAVLRAVLSSAYKKWRWLESMPYVPMIGQKKQNLRWLTPDEFDRLHSELPEHLADAAQFAVLTGMRMRAMLRLTWDRVDLETRWAWVPGEQQKNGQPLGIPLSSEVTVILTKLRQNGTTTVFAYRGKPIDDCNTAAFKRAVAVAQLGNVRWHDLRHTFAAWAVQAGVPLIELMKLGGWKDYRSVLIYAHLSVDQLRNSADLVAQKRHSARALRLKSQSK